MVNFIEGSGFYPPTINDASQFSTNTQTTNPLFLEHKVTASERTQVTSISYFYQQVSSTAGSGTMNVQFKIGNVVLFQFSHSALAAANNTYYEVTLANQSLILEKGQSIGWELTYTGVGGGSPTILTTVGYSGSYIFY